MRNEPYFTNAREHGHAALEANFQCACGSNAFGIVHSGTLHKSIFGGVSLRKREKQLVIRCECSKCAEQYTLFDSTKDGVQPKGTPLEEFAPLEIKGETLFEIKVLYNFLEENFRTDRFEMFFLEVKPSASGKYMRVYEE